MRTIAPALLLSAVVSSPAAAQERTAQSEVHAAEVPRAVAVPATSSLHVDGRLEEAAWAEAPPITEFTQLDPSEGEPVSQPTAVRFLYDDQALYIGAVLRDAGDLTARLGRRDMGMSASDWLTVIIDSYHDHRTAYGFEINPAGVRRDQTRSPSGEDNSWDPVWQVETTVSDSGWVAEMRIPFSQLRFSGADVQTWGLQVERQINRRQEFAVWSFTPRDEPGGIPRFGHLTGLEAIPTGKRLEVLPYMVARAEYVERGANPFRGDEEFGLDAGLDLKLRATSNLTLDATLNPDFGQVEVDPAVVNLTAFETFFPEKRPFFVEGAEIFEFGSDGTNSVFYSRRIGGQPTLRPPYPQRDVPDATRIIGAAKLSGKTADGWSIGVLDALTARERSRFVTPDGDRESMVSEPVTNYLVSRVRREVRGGLTAVGGFIGAVNRHLETDLLESELPSAAYSGGVDLFHQWNDRTWTLDGFLAGSRVLGSADAIADVQRLPYHYFQRPDAAHLQFDPTRTDLSGFAGSLSLSKRVGRHWNGSVGLSTTSPGYEVSDLGFQRRADRIDAMASVNYSESRPGNVLRSWALFGTALVEHNYDGENISNRIFPGSYFQFLNYWNGNVSLALGLPGTTDDRLTRGGPVADRPGYVSLSGRLGTDPRRALVGDLGTFIQRDEEGGSSFNAYLDLQLRPAPSLELSVGPSYTASYSSAQYLFALPDPTATATYGRRYVFADIDQRVFAFETRLDYTVRPGLSLQIYAQPFIATGDYGAPREFAAPGTYDFLVYGQDTGEVVDGVIYPEGQGAGAVTFPVPQPDFSIRSLRGNAVLRWEWRPGSTLYLAWQQIRQGSEPVGDFDFGRDTDALAGLAPDNVFVLKVNYWLNP